MLFNSIEFACFFVLVFIFYWFVLDKLKVQNYFILFASYLFYGWWDWRFLLLIFFSTLLDFLLGALLYKSNNESQRKYLLWTSVSLNLGLLGVFKYYNFFVDNLVSGLSFLGVSTSFNTLQLILPVGISFYTFQTMSYTIDIYRKKLVPTTNFISFASFVSFFPQLVAGPIERARHLLPQFEKKRTFSYENSVDGLRQILWGLFKKIVIADNSAIYVNQIFENYSHLSGLDLIFGIVLFTIQLYCDFSGYSDIALGTARLLGFNLSQNFAYPYFSKSIVEFWSRWHISLTTWFRDYLFVPIASGRSGKLYRIGNTFILFGLIGFWHGPRWTYIVYGLINAFYLIPSIIFRKGNREIAAKGKNLPSLSESSHIFITYFFTLLAGVFFRSKTIGDATLYLKGIFSPNLYKPSEFLDGLLPIFILIGFFQIIEWLGREHKHPLETFSSVNIKGLRWGFYLFISLLIFLYGIDGPQYFYFQF